jgi:uncharacterized protein (TIGR02186 family)
MSGYLIMAVLYVFWFANSAMGAQAQRPPELVESDISSRNIAIESNFTGQRIVIFGTIENSEQSEFEPGLYDVIVAIRGPRERIVARKKSQVAGIWINSDSQTFANAPGYYALLTGRELKNIATPTILNAYNLGFDNLAFRPLGTQAPGHVAGDLGEFRRAVIRIKQREGLYIYDPKGVVFVGRNLFRATVDLPANVPVGQYATDVYLLREGEVLSNNRSQLTIRKAGFERFVYSAAFDYPLFYGIIAVIIAVTAGLLASALTRRD